MKYRLLFYGTETRILGMMHRRNRIYISILKKIAKGMGGHVPSKYRTLSIQQASDAADTIIKDETYEDYKREDGRIRICN